MDIRIREVGEVRSACKEATLVLRDGGLDISDCGGDRTRARDLVSEVVVHEEYSECLEGIEGFSHVVVLYWSHLVGEEGRRVKMVHPAGQQDMPLVGVFSTRSPARPNPVCLTTVELVERRGNVLEVKGLDAVDGSPVIDIKPHHPHFDAPGGVHLAGWMNELMTRFASASGGPGE